MKYLLLGMIFCLFAYACTPAEKPAAPAIHSTKDVSPTSLPSLTPSASASPSVGALSVTEKDCLAGLQKPKPPFKDGCGTWLESDGGSYIGGYNEGWESEVIVGIGENRYLAKAANHVWAGENFKITIQEGKPLNHCIDSKGERIMECESDGHLATVILECLGKKKIYKNYRSMGGC